jgi:hypothetical protein
MMEELYTQFPGFSQQPEELQTYSPPAEADRACTAAGDCQACHLRAFPLGKEAQVLNGAGSQMRRPAEAAAASGVQEFPKRQGHHTKCYDGNSEAAIVVNKPGWHPVPAHPHRIDGGFS